MKNALIYQGNSRIYNNEELEMLQALITRENEIDISHTATYSYKLEKYLISSGLYDTFDIINCLFSVLINIIYCITTYSIEQSKQEVLNIIEYFLIIAIIFHFIIKLYISQARLYFLSSIESIIDLGTIIPIMLLKLNILDEFSSYYLKVARMIRFLYLYKLEYILQKRVNETIRFTYKLLFYVFAIILISSCLILEVENYDIIYYSNINTNDVNLSENSINNSTNLGLNTYSDNIKNFKYIENDVNQTVIYKNPQEFKSIISDIEKNKVELINKYKYHDMIYFTLVTLGTIGYGDIVPKTIFGRFIIIGTIFLLLALIPTLTTKLISVLALTSKYSRTSYRKISKKTKHLILLGSSDVEGYEAFLNELYHEDHVVVDYQTVIMQIKPNEDLMNSIKLLPYADKIHYLVGNSLNQIDLERCKADSSLCVVLLANKLSKNPRNEDFSNILQAFSIKKFSKINSGNDVRICMQLLRPETKELYFQSLLSYEDLNSSDQVICVEEIKLLLLGKSCLCPGINTIVSSLITSSKPKPSDIVEAFNNKSYNEYVNGMQNEIYRIKMEGEVIEGIKFIYLVKLVYDISEIVVIGADCIKDEEDDPVVSINPYNYVFNGLDHDIYVLSDKLPNSKSINEEILLNIKPEDRDINPEHFYSNYNNNNKKKFINKDTKAKNYNSKIKNNNNTSDSTKDNSNNSYFYNQFSYNIHIDKLRIKNVSSQKPKFIQTIYPRTGYESEHFSLEILSNHIIVIGLIQNMKSLIMPLRSLGNKNQQYPILIFDKEDHILSEIWKDIQFFPEVYYMQGNPIKSKDLFRAGIKKAKAVIILNGNNISHEDNNEMLDADIIFIYKAIRNENKNVLIITELASISTIGFLSTNDDMQIQKQYRLSEQFAVGEIYTNSMLDTLMCQAFYNPYITKIIQQLILGSAMYNYTNEEIRQMQEKKISHSTLYLLNIYEELEKWDIASNTKILKYYKIFEYFIERNMVPIGVYRGSKSDIASNDNQMDGINNNLKDLDYDILHNVNNNNNFSKTINKINDSKKYSNLNSMSRYVFLMPDKDANINIEYDKIFVLASEDEKDISGKVYNRNKDITNTNSYFMKHLEKSNEHAFKLLESIKDTVNFNQDCFKKNFSIKKIINSTRQSIRKELVNIYDKNVEG